MGLGRREPARAGSAAADGDHLRQDYVSNLYFKESCRRVANSISATDGWRCGTLNVIASAMLARRRSHGCRRGPAGSHERSPAADRTTSSTWRRRPDGTPVVDHVGVGGNGQWCHRGRGAVGLVAGGEFGGQLATSRGLLWGRRCGAGGAFFRRGVEVDFHRGVGKTTVLMSRPSITRSLAGAHGWRCRATSAVRTPARERRAR